MDTFKLSIVTINKKTLSWKSLNKKVAFIKKALEKTGKKWEVEVTYQDLKPEVIDGRISHAWYNGFSYPLFRQGNHFIYIHFSMRQWALYKLQATIRGANQTDTDFVGESYGRGDENTKRGKTKYNQFEQNVLHEMSHEIARTTSTLDVTHYYHDTYGDISGIFATYNMDKWQPEYQAIQKKIGEIQTQIKVLEAQKASKKGYIHPLLNYLMTQGYGVRNEKFYPRTKHHQGTDYGTPIGTGIIAPANGEITAVGTDKYMGNWCEFFDGKIYFYFLHLREVPTKKVLAQGGKVGFTGNTGLSTGPHCHIEAWKQKRDISLLTEQNFRQYTIDPATLWA